MHSNGVPPTFKNQPAPCIHPRVAESIVWLSVWCFKSNPQLQPQIFQPYNSFQRHCMFWMQSFCPNKNCVPQNVSMNGTSGSRSWLGCPLIHPSEVDLLCVGRSEWWQWTQNCRNGWANLQKQVVNTKRGTLRIKYEWVQSMLAMESPCPPFNPTLVSFCLRRNTPTTLSATDYMQQHFVMATGLPKPTYRRPRWNENKCWVGYMRNELR